MKLNRKETELLDRAIQYWQEKAILPKEKAEELRKSYQTSPYNWKAIAQYAFVGALLAGIAAFVIALKTDIIVDLFYSLIYAPYGVLGLIFVMLATGTIVWGMYRRKTHPTRLISNELILLIGGFLIGGALIFFGRAFDEGLHHFSILFLVGTFIYLILGSRLPSLLIWSLALISLGCWYATETAWWVDGDPYFMGMNYPIRFIFYGLFLSIAGLLIKRSVILEPFFETTYISGLFCFFFSLWVLSFFGNYSDFKSWYLASSSEFIPYGLLLGGICLLAMWISYITKDRKLQGFALLFFLINIYTKFVEFGWPNMHAALFFCILAVSFWVIGKKAESLLALGGIKQESNLPS